jgi:hypothetical protein
MRIGWSSFNAPAKRAPTKRTPVDVIARELAEENGVNWEELNTYPGYGKNRWRELAEQFLAASPTLERSWH